MCIKIGNKTLRFSFLFAVFLAFAANTAGGRNILFSFLFSFLHEMVHLVFLHLSGIKKAELVFLPAAIRIYCEGLNLLSYKKTVLCSLSAPVFNLVTGAVFCLLMNIYPSENIKICVVINFILGLINLLPMQFLDGGRTIKALLCKKYEECRVNYIMTVLSVWSVVVLFLIFFMGFIMGKVQMFLLFFCIYCVLGTFFGKS